MLGVLAVLAASLAVARDGITTDALAIRRSVRVAAFAVAAQSVHFLEELATGFHERLPELFGRPPMPLWFFVSFNVLWLAIWALSARGLAHRSRAALFPLWFLGLASVANGGAHPLFSAATGGYFPGLLTSPLVGVVGLLLVRRLLRVTHPSAHEADPV